MHISVSRCAFLQRPISSCYWMYCFMTTRPYDDSLLNVFFFFYLFIVFNCKVLTYNTYLQTMYDTYATNRTILYLQKKAYLQCEILTLLTILYSTYNTKLAILTYNEMLTLLKVLYSLSSYLRGKSTLTKFGHRVLVLLKPSLWIQMYSGVLLSLPKK